MTKQKQHPALLPKEVEWVVNDLGELGVRIHGTSYFLYKGESVSYTEKHEDGSSMKVRRVQKREFGEVCRPQHFLPMKSEEKYTEGESWTNLT